MALISRIILYLIALIFPFGQLLRLNLFGVSFPVIDIFIGILSISNILIKIRKKNLIVKNKYFLYFMATVWLSFIINFFRYHFYSLSPFFYLLRLSFLISFLIFPIELKDKVFSKLFTISIISAITFGLIQYFFWPDFTYFDAVDWDPHLFRLVGSFFDPTFTAFIFLSFLIYIFLNHKNKWRWPLLIITYVSMALTYSRSTYIAFLMAFSFISLKLKKPKIFLMSLIIIISTIFILPRQVGEGTKLERTSSIMAKIENYKEGLMIFSRSPILGHGYNNLALIRELKIPSSHANNGFDSSLMTILTTTGVIGLFFFVLGLTAYFLKSDLTHKTILISLLVHSLFANSLLYPWIILVMILI
jgi:hypothetical protein